MITVASMILSFLLSLSFGTLSTLFFLKLIKCLQEVRNAIIELLVLSTELIGLRLSFLCGLSLTTTFNFLKRGAERLVIALADSEQLSIVCFHGFANCVSMDSIF